MGEGPSSSLAPFRLVSVVLPPISAYFFDRMNSSCDNSSLGTESAACVTSSGRCAA